MKTLIIYDGEGTIINTKTGFYKVPVNIPYIEIDNIPIGKFVASVDAETKDPIYEDIPKNETQILRDEISILNEQNSKLLLDKAKNEIQINTLNKNLANVTLEVAKMKGGM
ncbi:hypothetical protein [Clostridium sp. CCUG 7971]|uniref:hypothetical protein n=1 Tax=Clostridium sp. CCUG 7971 TaxID=2811414 RepID=UPI001ABABE63|nr:hypothetical protein [Clostridium sp. CCUG 7971]MBO3443421.1 hypothetical protein [Clostridium sp. CCUG 7971]